MKRAIKLLSVSLLTISLTIVLTDFHFFILPDSYSVSSVADCPSIDDHFEDPHPHGQEDHSMIHDYRTKNIHFSCNSDISPSESEDFRNDYIFVIWQPPKVS